MIRNQSKARSRSGHGIGQRPGDHEARHILDQFGVAYHKQVISAHRTPELMAQFAQTPAPMA